MQLCPAPSASSTEPDGADALLPPPPPLLGKSTLESFIYNSGLLLRNSFLGAELRTVLNCATYFLMLGRNSHQSK